MCTTPIITNPRGRHYRILASRKRNSFEFRHMLNVRALRATTATISSNIVGRTLGVNNDRCYRCVISGIDGHDNEAENTGERNPGGIRNQQPGGPEIRWQGVSYSGRQILIVLMKKNR